MHDQSGGDDGIRTHDLYVANVPLSQLSYIPTCTLGTVINEKMQVYFQIVGLR